MAGGAVCVPPAMLEQPLSPEKWTENAIGWMPVPIGAATGFRVNGRDIPAVPMATMERTVVAAASYAAELCRKVSGFTVITANSFVSGQICFARLERGNALEHAKRINAEAEAFVRKFRESFDPLRRHGGGLECVRAGVVPGAGNGILLIEFDVRTGEAMGASAVTRMAESYAEAFASIVGMRRTAAIVTNASHGPEIEASGSWRIKHLGEEVVERMSDLHAWACRDESRATTHNKGVMNGISAVALASGQDVPAIEAAAGAFARRTGRTMPLTTLEKFGDALQARLRVRIPLATVGGATDLPVATYCRRLMGAGTVTGLAAVCGAVGLAQNVAALRCLADEGIGASSGRR